MNKLENLEKVTHELIQTWGNANNKIKELENLLNEHNTKRTLGQDLTEISNNLEDLRQRINNDDKYFEEDNITLGWTLDLIDYLYKIIKELRNI